MPLALPLRLLVLLHLPRLPRAKPAPKRGATPQIDLCALTRYLRRDIGFDAFDCETREDWRKFR